MEARSSKRKHSPDAKMVLVPQLYELNNESFKLTEDLHTANDDFLQLFKSIGDRQSEIYARSVGLDEKYEHMLALLKGDITGYSGPIFNPTETLPSSYNSDTGKFFDDTCLSLDSHSKAFVQQVNEMMKELDEQATIWKGKLTEMKKHAEHIVSQRTKLAAKLSDFVKEN